MVVGGGVSSNPEARSKEERFHVHVQYLIPNADHGREGRKAQQGGNGPIDQHARLRDFFLSRNIFLMMCYSVAIAFREPRMLRRAPSVIFASQLIWLPESELI